MELKEGRPNNRSSKAFDSIVNPFNGIEREVPRLQFRTQELQAESIQWNWKSRHSETDP